MQLKNRKRFEWIQKNIRKFNWLQEVSKNSTPRQAWHYASKEDTRLLGPWEWGEKPEVTQGKRTDIVSYVRAIQAGATDLELVENHPSAFATMRHVPHTIRALIRPIRTIPLEVYVFYGAAGTGKSRAVREMHPDVYVIPFNRQGLWLTTRGDMAKIVLLEDFDGNLPLKQFNRIVDIYPEEVEIKGGHVWWMPEILFITTNTLPSQWYPDDDRQDTLAQIFRRINWCFDFNTPEGVDMTKGISCKELCDRFPDKVRVTKKKGEGVGSVIQKYFEIKIQKLERERMEKEDERNIKIVKMFKDDIMDAPD